MREYVKRCEEDATCGRTGWLRLPSKVSVFHHKPHLLAFRHAFPRRPLRCVGIRRCAHVCRVPSATRWRPREPHHGKWAGVPSRTHTVQAGFRCVPGRPFGLCSTQCQTSIVLIHVLAACRPCALSIHPNLVWCAVPRVPVVWLHATAPCLAPLVCML